MMNSFPSIVEHQWFVLLEHMSTRSLTRLVATCRGVRASCLKLLLDARRRDEERFFARLLSDLRGLGPLERACDSYSVRFHGIPHHLAGNPLEPGTRTVSVRQRADRCVEIVIRNEQVISRENIWTVRSELTEVSLVPDPSSHMRRMYLGRSIERFDVLWGMVGSGAIATMPVDHTWWF
jgi:hypothetical protein